MLEVTRLVYRKPEAAKALGISIDTLDRLIQRGELKAIRISRSVSAVSATELERFVREHENEA